MTTEGPISMNMKLPNRMFPGSKDSVPVTNPSLEDTVFYSNQNMVTFGQRDGFVAMQDGNPFECSTSSTVSTNPIVNNEQSGNLIRGYSFLADQIYRSVSNPLYKLMRTVEDTVGDGAPMKPVDEQAPVGDESFLHYQKFYDSTIKSGGGVSFPKDGEPNLTVSACVKFESGEGSSSNFDGERKQNHWK